MDFEQAKTEFQQHFPNIDFSDCTSGNEQFENRIVEHINDVTPEQWELIISREYAYELMHTGTPHISWEDDLRIIGYGIAEHGKLVYDTFWDETWYHCTRKDYEFNGIVFSIVRDEPKIYSQGRTRYHISILKKDEVRTRPTHTAVILALDENGKAYISYQNSGTLSECEDWVSEKMKKMSQRSTTFKIIDRKI